METTMEKLFEHNYARRKPKNVNELHKETVASGGFNAKFAVFLTKNVGTMWTAYLFTGICMVGLLAIFGALPAIVVALVLWMTSEFFSLVLLPIIMVGQNILGKKSELQAEEQFKATMSSYQDIEGIMKHLDSQDAELLRHTKMLEDLLKTTRNQESHYS
jgi:uncharacterized membrane protein